MTLLPDSGVLPPLPNVAFSTTCLDAHAYNCVTSHKAVSCLSSFSDFPFPCLLPLSEQSLNKKPPSTPRLHFHCNPAPASTRAFHQTRLATLGVGVLPCKSNDTPFCLLCKRLHHSYIVLQPPVCQTANQMACLGAHAAEPFAQLARLNPLGFLVSPQFLCRVQYSTEHCTRSFVYYLSPLGMRQEHFMLICESRL